MHDRLRSRVALLAGGGFWLASQLAACGNGGGMPMDAGVDLVPPPPDLRPPSCTSTPTFTTIQTQILSQCAGDNCHTKSPYQGGLNLSVGSAYANLVGVTAMEAPTYKRVEPGTPAASFVWRKLDAELPVDQSQGSPMPLGAENFWFPLPAAQRAMVYCWIQAGAANN
jgi:hypothetical protein